MSDNKWKMPEPVFRRTSGSLPEDFAARVASPAAPVDAAAPDVGDDNLSSLYAPPEKSHRAPVAAPDLDGDVIEPQPFVSEQFSLDEAATPAPAKPRVKRQARSIFFVLGITVLLAMAAGFVVLVYLLFFRQPPQTTF